MPRAMDPSLDHAMYAGGIEEPFAGDGGYGIHVCEVVNGQARSQALQVSKHKRVAESSNRQGDVEGPPEIAQGPYQLVSASNEDAQRVTSFVATPSCSSDVGSTKGATSSAFVSVPGRNFPSQFLPAQTTVGQRDNPLWPQAFQSHAGDFYTEQGNLSHASGNQGLTPEALPTMGRPPNAEVGCRNTVVPQDKCFEVQHSNLEKPWFSLAKLEEDIASVQGYMNDIILHWKSMKEYLSRVVRPTEALPLQNVIQMKWLIKEVEEIHLFLKDKAKQRN